MCPGKSTWRRSGGAVAASPEEFPSTVVWPGKKVTVTSDTLVRNCQKVSGYDWILFLLQRLVPRFTEATVETRK